MRIKTTKQVIININFYLRDDNIIPSVLTERQEFVLQYIKDFLKKNRVPPRILDIQRYIGAKSLRTVSQYLEVLERKNLIKRKKFGKRSVELV